MNPHHLRSFLAVGRHLNYTRAADEIFLSQPAVSRQIRQLEQDLGVRLFEQIGKSLHLTDAGRTLTVEAEKLLGSMERAAEIVRAHRTAEHGSLRVGASTTPGLYVLPRILGRFHRAYPGVDLRYSVRNSLRIEQMIVRNELDLAFVGAHLTHEDLCLEPVMQDEILCFAGPEHELSQRSGVDPRALADETWVIREEGSATRRLFESWLAAHDVRIKKAIELESPEAVKALVAAGIGLSFMSVHGLNADTERGELRPIDVAGLPLQRPVFLVRHREKHESPVMQAFLENARHTLAGVSTTLPRTRLEPEPHPEPDPDPVPNSH